MGYEALPGGQTRKWGEYSCQCDATGRSVTFVGPGYPADAEASLGKNLLGVSDQVYTARDSQTGRAYLSSTGQTVSPFSAYPNPGAFGAFVNWLNDVDATFINAYQFSYQEIP